MDESSMTTLSLMTKMVKMSKLLKEIRSVILYSTDRLDLVEDIDEVLK